MTVTAFQVCLNLWVSDIILFLYGTKVRLSGKPCKRSVSIGVGLLTANELGPYPPSFWTTNILMARIPPVRQLALLLGQAMYWTVSLFLLLESMPKSCLFFSLWFLPCSVLISINGDGVFSLP